MSPSPLASRRIFVVSFAVSLAIHAATLFFLQNQSYQTRMQRSLKGSVVLFQEKERMRHLCSLDMKLAGGLPYERLLVSASQSTSDQPLLQEIPGLCQRIDPPPLEQKETPDPMPLFAIAPPPFEQPLIPPPPLVIDQQISEETSISSSFFSRVQDLPLVHELVYTLEAPSLFHPEMRSTRKCPPLPTTSPSFSFLRREEFLYQPATTVAAQKTDDHSVQRAVRSLPIAALPRLPNLEELSVTSCSNAFQVELTCTPRKDRPGYLFAITLTPSKEPILPKLRQSFTFLIDRSHAISLDRLSHTKSAVLKALEELSGDDSFNIIAFDSKLSKLFPTPHLNNLASRAQAKLFLDQMTLGSFFGTTDLYTPLLLTLPTTTNPGEVHTAILLSDGEALRKADIAQSVLQTWSLQNRGIVSLFAVAVTGDPQLANLHLACFWNKGRLSFPATPRYIKRNLIKLMKSLQNPIAQQIRCSVISNPKMEIELFPPIGQVANLYRDQPLVILGTCDHLNDFSLFIQGRLDNRWLQIRKTISFISAKEGGGALHKEWALQQAYQHYNRYLIDHDPEHLTQAYDLITPYGIQPALQ